ncbi:MAG: AI-2E family transporter [Armatimonadia bacterium]
MEQWTTRRVALLTLTVGIVLYLVYYVPGAVAHFVDRVWDVVVILILATALAVLLSPAVGFLCRVRLPLPARLQRVAATLLAMVGCVALLWLVVSLMATQLFHETEGILQVSKTWLAQAPTQLQMWLDAHSADFPPEVVSRVAGAATQMTQSLLQYQFGFAKGALLRGWYIVELLIVPVLAFYFLIDGDALRNGTIASAPKRYRQFVRDALSDVSAVLHSYVRAQVLLCGGVAVAVGLILKLCGVSTYLSLAVLAGVLRMAPIVGPIVGGVFCVGLPLIQNGVHTGLVVLLCYWLLFVVDGKLLTPILLAGSAMLHPVLVIISLLLGYEFFGVLGLLVAVPAAGILRALYLRYRQAFVDTTDDADAIPTQGADAERTGAEPAV